MLRSKTSRAKWRGDYLCTIQRSSPLPPSWKLLSSSKVDVMGLPPLLSVKISQVDVLIQILTVWEVPLRSNGWSMHSRFHILNIERGKKLENPKSHLASFEEQILLSKLAWSNPFPWGEQGIWPWWVKSCSSADVQKAFRDIKVQIWWKVNETFTPNSLRSFWNFSHLSSKHCSGISLGNLRGWYYIGINSHFIDEETEVKWRAKGHTRSRVKGFRWRRISKGRGDISSFR